MLRFICIGACILLTQKTAFLRAEEPKRYFREEIKALIEKLASPNPAPIVRRQPTYGLPPKFDREKQEKVHEAWHELRKLGPQAFPFLIASCKDERYSLTTCNCLDGCYRNMWVGHVCRAIIEDQLQPYGDWQEGGGDPRDVARRPSYPLTFLSSEKDMKEWWDKHETKTLYESQLEVLDWVIAEEAKQPGKFTDKEKQILQERRKKLVDGGRPFPAGNYGCEEIEDFKQAPPFKFKP